MSDSKRTLPVINQEYANLCVKAGNLQYQIVVFQTDLALLNEELRELNFEAAKLQAEAKETKAE